MPTREDMPYHLLHETQAVKDRLLAHRVQGTCMAPIPLLQQQQQQQQASTLSASLTHPASVALSQLPASQDAFLTAALPPLPQQLQTLKETLPTIRTSPLNQRTPTVSAPQSHRPLHALSPTISPLFLIPVIIVILILLIRLELRLLEAHASLFDRLDTWFRRFHKGTSKFRHKPPHPPSSKLDDNNKTKHAKPKRQSGQLAAPGWMAKQAVVSAGKWVMWAVRRSIQENEGSREVLVRSFDGLPIAPVARRPGGFGGKGYISLPLMVAAPIAYGVPPPLKPPRTRRSTIALNALEPEAALEGEVISVLRQQAIADEEASTAADPLMMRAPRGEDGGEERDLEALEGRGLFVGFRGGEGLVVRRGWNGGVGAGGGEIV